MTEQNIPNAADAERAVLGCMLLSGVASEIAMGLLTPDDFYNPKNAELFAAFLAAHTDGHPLDQESITEAFTRGKDANGTLADRRFVAQTLGSDGWVSTSIERYCQIVIDAGARRKILSATIEVAGLVRDGSAPAPEILVRARELIDGVDVETTAFMPEGLSTLDEFFDRPEESKAPWVIPGMLRRNWRIMVVAGEGAGKLLRLDESIPTPAGWSTIGDLEVGDEVFDLRGDPCEVTALSAVDLAPETFTVRFSDGVEIEACADHEWVTVTYEDRRKRNRGGGPPGSWPMSVFTTRQIGETIWARGGHCLNHAVPVAGALQVPDADLPVGPYTLGVWLGDGDSGCAAVTLNDWDAPSIIARLETEGETPRHPSTVDDGKGARRYGLVGTAMAERLRAIKVLGAKHVPAVYLRASVKQRQALLEGLMDSDGYAPDSPPGRGGGATLCELTFTNEALAAGVAELVRSLGMKCSVAEAEEKLNGRYISQRWRITFTPDRQVFSCPRKADRVILPVHTYRSQLRYVESVTPCASSPMRCLTVDSPDHTYLAGRAMVPTHNSVLLRQMAISAAAGLHPMTHRKVEPRRALIVDLENPDEAVEEVCAPMKATAEGRVDWDPDRCWLWHQPQGINLRKRSDRVEFESVIRMSQPDIVCFGPVYKSFVSSAAEDEAATGEVQHVLDDLRIRHNFGVVLEHHAPHGQDGRKREIRPHGSVRWQRWPEMGIAMYPVKGVEGSYDLRRFRGDRVKASWPDRVDRSGSSWPWAGVYPSGTYNVHDPEEDSGPAERYF